MTPYEMDHILKAINQQQQTDLEFQRYWAYLNISCFTNKITSPNKLVSFPWETQTLDNELLSKDQLEARKKALWKRINK
jgi:hypothetical protein